MSTEAVAPATLSDSIDADLLTFFQNEGSPQIDNSEETKVVAEEAPEEVAEPGKEAETVEPEKVDEPAEEEVEESIESDDGELKFLSSEEIEEKFARSNTKGLRALTAQYSAEAQKGHEAITNLGGEHFIEPLQTISKAIQSSSENPLAIRGIYDGVLEAGSHEALFNLIDTTIRLGFIDSDNWLKNPDTKAYGLQLQATADAAIEHKFGVTTTQLREMAEWAKVGWLDKLKQWTDDNYVDTDELDEMLALNQNPAAKKLAEENATLKRQLQSNAEPDSAAETAKESEAEKEFGTFTRASITDSLTKVIWKNSPLKDVPADSPELKADKEYFRTQLIKAALDQFNSGNSKSTLLREFRTGKQHTSIYKTALTHAVSDAVKAIKPDTDRAEKILARSYGKTRNAMLAPKPEAPTTSAPKTPTVTAPLKAANRPKTIDEIDNELLDYFKGQ